MNRKAYGLGIVAMALIAALLATGAALAQERVIRWFAGPWGPNHHAWKGGLAESLAAFEQENGVKVEVIFHPRAQDRHDQFIVNVMAGTPPDVISIGALGFLPQQGLITDLTPFIERSEQASFSDYPPAIWPRLTVNGGVYAVPVEAIPNWALIYDKAAFDEAGLAHPDPNSVMTWDDVWAMAPRLDRVSEDGRLLRVAIDPLSASGKGARRIAASWGIDILDANGEANLATGEWEAALENAARPYWQYGVSTVRALSGWSDRLQNGFQAMQINGPWTPRELETRGFTGELGYTWIPQQQGLRSQDLSAWLVAMPTGIKDPELAWKFIEWFAFGDGARARSRAEATPFVGPSSRPDPDLIRLNPGIEWFVQSLTAAELMMPQDANPLWAEIGASWVTQVLNPVTERSKSPMQALADYEIYLESFLENQQ